MGIPEGFSVRAKLGKKDYRAYYFPFRQNGIIECAFEPPGKFYGIRQNGNKIETFKNTIISYHYRSWGMRKVYSNIHGQLFIQDDWGYSEENRLITFIPEKGFAPLRFLPTKRDKRKVKQWFSQYGDEKIRLEENRAWRMLYNQDIRKGLSLFYPFGSYTLEGIGSEGELIVLKNVFHLLIVV